MKEKTPSCIVYILTDPYNVSYVQVKSDVFDVFVN